MLGFAQELDKLAKSPGIKKSRIKYKTFQKNKVPLEPEERAEVMKRGAIWHHGPDGAPSPAVSKAVINNKTLFETSTHRAINYAPTLRGAISRYHRFIKGTA